MLGSSHNPLSFSPYRTEPPRLPVLIGTLTASQGLASIMMASSSSNNRSISKRVADDDSPAYLSSPLIKRKRRAMTSSLIGAGMKPAAAAVLRDFPSNLGLTASTGSMLFPPADNKCKSWSPPQGVSSSPNDGALQVTLNDFDDVSRAATAGNNNTVAIQLTAPADSKRFSINIATESDANDNFESVLFHFNPRQWDRGGQLVLNNKLNGTWGQAIQIPLSQMPVLFGQSSCTLMVQISSAGFDVSLGEQRGHIARLQHRTKLPAGTSTNLILQFPSTDDYGNPERVSVHKVWWGHKPLLAAAGGDNTKTNIAAVPGVKHFKADHPRKIFISQLRKIYTQDEVDWRRAEMERAFHKYSGGTGVVQVIVPTDKTYAFVELPSECLTNLALQEMATKYSMSRARRSKHQALKEERANKAAKLDHD